jgi:hypothetical protein
MFKILAKCSQSSCRLAAAIRRRLHSDLDGIRATCSPLCYTYFNYFICTSSDINLLNPIVLESTHQILLQIVFHHFWFPHVITQTCSKHIHFSKQRWYDQNIQNNKKFKYKIKFSRCRPSIGYFYIYFYAYAGHLARSTKH